MRLVIGDAVIRRFAPGDAEALVRHADDRRVWRHLRDRFPHPYTMTDARAWLAHAALEDPAVSFAIASGDELVGGIGLVLGEDVHRRTAEIGYWIGPALWNRGIATRAVGAFTRWAFERFDLDRIHGDVFEGNDASARVLEKCGYVFEGRLRKSVFKDGRTLDQLVYATVREPRPAAAASRSSTIVPITQSRRGSSR